MAAVSDGVLHRAREAQAQRVLVEADRLLAACQHGHQARTEEALAVDDVVVFGLPQLADQGEEVLVLGRALIPDMEAVQERMPMVQARVSTRRVDGAGGATRCCVKAKEPLIPLAHHQVDGRIRIPGVQLLHDARHQHGVAQEGGLDDEEALHSSRSVMSTLSMRLPSMSITSPWKCSSVIRSPTAGMRSSLLRK